MCPTCHTPLEARKFGGVQVRACPTCHGLLVTRGRLVPLLEAAEKALVEAQVVEEPVPDPPDRSGERACPGCGAAMAPLPYMGDDAVLLDRCSACDVVWLDPGEVAAAARLLAGTYQRVDRHRERLAAEEAVMNATMDRIRWNSKMADRLARLLI